MAGTPVITQVQARQITGDRLPLIPVEYEAAVHALQACCSLDETKYWSDKADALAAWAKIYRDNNAVLKAKRLKLHAYRRMGEIAAELRPAHTTKTRGPGGGPGALPGPRALLKGLGLPVSGVDAARKLAMLPKAEFERIVEDRPVAPSTLRYLNNNTPWRDIARSAMALRSDCRKRSAAEVVDAMAQSEITSASALVCEIMDWLDDFEHRLRAKAKTAPQVRRTSPQEEGGQ